MYFQIEPKYNKEDLFLGDGTYNELLHLLQGNTKLIVLKGLRRTGKTSTLNVALTESKLPFVNIDVRVAPYTNRQTFLDFIAKEIIRRLEKNIITKIINRLETINVGVNAKYISTSLNFKLNKESDFITILEEINQNKFIIAFDEAQYLSGIGFDKIIASIYDRYKNIKIVLTGSEIGLLEKFLGHNNKKAPLYGRLYEELKTSRFVPKISEIFLTEGFKQTKTKISELEIGDTIKQLDGIIGWLTYYGYSRTLSDKKYSHKEAIDKVFELGVKITAQELSNFLVIRKGREKYLTVIKSIANGDNTWSKIKGNLIKTFNIVSDTQLNLYLKELMRHNFIDKENGNYVIPDPLLQHALLQNQI